MDKPTTDKTIDVDDRFVDMDSRCDGVKMPKRYMRVMKIELKDGGRFKGCLYALCENTNISHGDKTKSMSWVDIDRLKSSRYRKLDSSELI